MDKLVVYNHYKGKDKEKREQEIIQAIIKLIKKKNSL